MSEGRHQRLQGYSGVDQGGGIGMSELMRGDVFQAYCLCRSVEFLSYGVLRESFSVVGEQEIRWCSGAGMDHRPTG